MVTVPPKVGGYIQKSNAPEGTLFIAVGSVLGALGLAVLAWRGIVAWSVNRSVRRSAMLRVLGVGRGGGGNGSKGGGGGSHRRSRRRRRRSGSGIYPSASGAPMQRIRSGSGEYHSGYVRPPDRGNGSELFFSPTASRQDRQDRRGGGGKTKGGGGSYAPSGYSSIPGGGQGAPTSSKNHNNNKGNNNNDHNNKARTSSGSHKYAPIRPESDLDVSSYTYTTSNPSHSSSSGMPGGSHMQRPPMSKVKSYSTYSVDSYGYGNYDRDRRHR